MKYFIIFALLFLARSGSAHEFNDDFGDTAATATPVVLGSNYTGRIEIDVDQDWFSFQATNSLKEYVVTVTTGTLWNSMAGLAAPDGVVMLAQTDSVSSVTSRVSWIHVGPPATYFVRVAGFASFTTGTYTLAVAERTFVDQDNDGIPDAWEIAYFGSTNQLPASDYDDDGVFNLGEFLAGTNPTNAMSLLAITALGLTNSQRSVAWSATAYRCYTVEVSTNLLGEAWAPLGTVTNLAALGSLTYQDGTLPLPPIRFYRVRSLY